jgi:hypothetical protein
MVQLMISMDKQPIQQPVTTLVPTTIQVTTSLPTHIPRGSNHQPLDGGQFRDSLGGSSLKGNPLGEPLLNALVGPFGWSTLDLRMFIPPWYQPHVVQPISKLATKLPYMKLQYPTHVKNIDPNAHIRVFKKVIKTNGEIRELDIINMFGFTLKDSISKWGENYVQEHPNYTFEKLEQAFCKRFKIVNNDEEVYM